MLKTKIARIHWAPMTVSALKDLQEMTVALAAWVMDG